MRRAQIRTRPVMRKCNNACSFYLQRLFSAILRAYHALNLPGVRGWRGAGQMGDCIGHLVAAGGIARTTARAVAGSIPHLGILEGGTPSTLGGRASGGLQLQSRSATGTASYSQSLGASGQG
jgi:hypothetical protein